MANDPRYWAERAADKPAIIMADSGETVSFRSFGESINRVSHLLHRRGLGRGDGIVIFAKNEPAFLTVCLGARYAGVDYTPVSKFLKADEIEYIVRNSGAKALFASAELAPVLAGMEDCPELRHRFVIGGEEPGFESFEQAIAGLPSVPFAAAAPGRETLYSSGTTGRPKGVRIVGTSGKAAAQSESIAGLTAFYGFDESTVNLTPAPLYHAGPLRYTSWVASTGGQNVIMERFDAERMLRAIEQYRVTHLEVVPTMLVRLLKLPAEVRERYDLSSLRFLAHAGAPCPPDVKRETIGWLGPIVHESYGGTEANGLCLIDTEDWLAHPGSVGKAIVGKLHIVSDDGEELPPGEAGLIYFEGGSRFEYLNDPERTAAAYSPQGWSTLGDIGYVDEEGFLYLADRKSNMIISGGVNIYPTDAENVLVAHPYVLDAAVFGQPDPEYGERVVALVQHRDTGKAAADLEADLIAFCKQRIASFKCPREIRFVEKLPRDDNGKLFKRRLIEAFQAVEGSATAA